MVKPILTCQLTSKRNYETCPSPRVSKGETCDLAVSPLLTRALVHSRQRTPGGNAFAFCGLGNPENFYSHLRLDGFTILANKGFRDHHFYSQSDISEIEREAADSGAEILLTTAKDAVKLSNLKFEIPCYVVEIETTLDDPERFAAMI